jgi:N-acetylglucosaminyldiphosphoundecaprenol N-acetyl-beta-D-mannosaminyltransferase
MNKFYLSGTILFNQDLVNIPDKKLLINTINAHCYNLAQTDDFYSEALVKSDILLPDGVSITMAKRFLTGARLKKIAGADLFYYEMSRLNNIEGTCFFLGSKESTLNLIRNHAEIEFPKVKIHTYSPPYKNEFSTEDNREMLQSINTIKPDVLFIGLTAPKQEKWAYKHFNELKVKHICSIGAVFDFYAGTVNRSPKWMIDFGLEWLYRLLKEPRRMWQRYLKGNTIFIWLVIKEKIMIIKSAKKQSVRI